VAFRNVLAFEPIFLSPDFEFLFVPFFMPSGFIFHRKFRKS